MPPPSLKRFKDTLALLRKMRSLPTAPVDTLGCATLASPSSCPHTHSFQILVALLLSSQTKDQVTAQVMRGLWEIPCSPESFAHMPIGDIEVLLKPVGFFRRKSVYLRDLSRQILDTQSGEEGSAGPEAESGGKGDGDDRVKSRRKTKNHVRKPQKSKTASMPCGCLSHDWKIPDTLKGLLDLPGIGPKMALLALQHCHSKVEGIPVDLHVHRISRRLEWSTANTPEACRKELESWIPKEYWEEINGLVVGFGQERCKAKPNCDGCLLGEAGMCPFLLQSNSF